MKVFSVYNNWSAYDELADTIELTEELAMRELDEMLRLRKAGARFDYYLMDAFWYDPDTGYRTWRKPNWPSGPDGWIGSCGKNGIKPGLWFSMNTLCKLNPVAAWEHSLNSARTAMCLFEGSFLSDFMDALQFWYDRGIRMYKLDFANFKVGTPEAEARYSVDEIRSRNKTAFRKALRDFRAKNEDAVFLAYNGFNVRSTNKSEPFEKTVDEQWLEVFDSLDCSDPRFSDVPMINHWRSVDLYSDHLTRRYEANGIPLARIDNAGFMMGQGGTCYHRKTAGWKGMLLLMLARGGHMNVFYGNLEYLDAEKGEWFAKAQNLFFPLQEEGQFYSFGGIPGKSEPYGYAAFNDTGLLYTLVNPSQKVEKVPLASVTPAQPSFSGGRVLFHDRGFYPKLFDRTVLRGPEQMCVIGYGMFDDRAFDMGIQEDVVIPNMIEPMDLVFQSVGLNTVSTRVIPPEKGDVRILVQQFRKGIAVRSFGGPFAVRKPVRDLLRLSIRQQDRELPVAGAFEGTAWSGLSWVAAEIKQEAMKKNIPLQIVFSSVEAEAVQIKGLLCRVEYP